MATFDQLSAEQRAIIELVLRQGKSYAELSDMLGMPEDRVRELAHQSLAQLAPVTARAVEEDWRGQLVDYVLGQQSGPQLTATRGHLRRSEAARAWMRSLLDSLDFLYPDGDLPQIPDSGGNRRERTARTPRAQGPLSPEAQAAVLRRRILAGAGIAALLLFVVLVWPIGVLTGDDSSDGDSQQASSDTQAAASTSKAAGVAVVALQDGKYRIVLTAARLPALKKDQAYEVWLYNSQGDAKSLGAQVLDTNGGFSGQSAVLPRATIEKYHFVDVSREPVDNDTAHSGDSVLRGRLSPIRDASPKGGQAAAVSRAVLTPPRG
ncbi:MAG TPA: anti-sigma factor [Thermoleophilaceae bacterium]